MGRAWDAATFGRTRRAHKMMRKLRQLDRADAKLRAAGKDPLEEWRASHDPRQPAGSLLATTRRRTTRADRTGRRAILAAVAVTVGVAALWTLTHQSRAAPHSPFVARPANFPAAGYGEQAHPLGTPAPAPAGTGGYQFTRT